MKKSILSEMALFVAIIITLIHALPVISPAMESDPSAVLSTSDELATMDQTIKAHKANWSAHATSMLALPPLERRKRVGLLKPSLNTQALATAQTQAESTSVNVLSAPTGPFDWRNFGGTNYVSPVRDQGSCGSCWAFAATAALESYTLIHGTYNSGLNLAEQILVSCSGAGSCSGGYIDRASDYVKGTGLPVETADPYSATNSACSIAALNWQNSTNRISSWRWVATTAPDVTTIKNAVYTFGPLVTTMNVYSDFYSYGSGVYHYVSGSYQGGHAILIVGYSDDASSPGGGYFTVKNSWGSAWGESGYFRIAYSELNSVVQFGHWSIAYDTSAPPPPATGVTLTPNAPSPQTVGTAIDFTASASGGTGSYEYQFQILPPGGSWSIKQGYTSTPDWSWDTTGLKAGSYGIFVGARSAGTNPTNGYDTYKIIYYTINSIPPATGVNLTPSITSPQSISSSVTFTAAGSGGSGSYEYEFYTLAPGTTSWVMQRPYSSIASWTWNTAGAKAGAWQLCVWIRNAGTAPTKGYDTYKTINYTLNALPQASAVALTPSVASPRAVGTPVTFTAAGTGGTGAYEYEFYLQAPGSTTWVKKQPYGPTAVWTWDTTGLAAGIYKACVWVRSAGSGPAAGYDKNSIISFEIKPMIVTLTPNVASPQSVSSSIAFTAAGSGGSGSYEYEFYTLAPGATSWVKQRPYNSIVSWTWNTSGAKAGTWQVCVWIRNAGTAPAKGYDSYQTITYTLNALPQASGITLTPNAATPQAVGTSITFTAAGAGGTGSYEYEFYLLTPGSTTWVKKQPYSSTATWIWSSAGAAKGTYQISVWVKTVTSAPAVGYDKYKTLTFTLN